MSNNEYYSTDNEDDDNEVDELSLSVEPCSGNLTDFSPAGTDDELEDQPLIEDYSTSPLEMNTSLLTGIGTPSSNMETSSVPSQTDPLLNEIPDSGEVNAFLAAGCGCSRAGGQPCSALFSKEHYEDVRLSCRELSRNELDMIVMGQIMAGIDDTPQVKHCT